MPETTVARWGKCEGAGTFKVPALVYGEEKSLLRAEALPAEGEVTAEHEAELDEKPENAAKISDLPRLVRKKPFRLQNNVSQSTGGDHQ